MPSGKQQVDAASIVSLVCHYTGYGEHELYGKSRARDLVEARIIAIYLTRLHTGLTLAKIGRHFNRDHSTVLHSIASVKTYSEVDGRFGEKLAAIKRLLPAPPGRPPGMGHWVVVGIR